MISFSVLELRVCHKWSTATRTAKGVGVGEEEQLMGGFRLNDEWISKKLFSRTVD